MVIDSVMNMGRSFAWSRPHSVVELFKPDRSFPCTIPAHIEIGMQSNSAFATSVPFSLTGALLWGLISKTFITTLAYPGNRVDTDALRFCVEALHTRLA